MEVRIWSTVLLVLALASAGCLGGVEDADAGADAKELDTHDAHPDVDTEKVDGTIMVSAATPAVTSNYGGAYAHTISYKEGLTGWIVELEWDAASPASEELSVWVRAAGAGTVPPEDPANFFPPPEPVAQVTGASPLRLEVPADAFPEEGEYDVLVRAAGPVGAAVEQPFALHLTHFHDVPFDASYSALDGEDAHDH